MKKTFQIICLLFITICFTNCNKESNVSPSVDNFIHSSAREAEYQKGVHILRNQNISVDYDGYPYTNWDTFYNAFKNRTENFYADGNGDGFQFGTTFRLQYYGSGVMPESNRGKATLSRYSPEYNAYVELVSLGTIQQCMAYLDFIHSNASPELRNAVSTFQIDAVFTNPNGSVV